MFDHDTKEARARSIALKATQPMTHISKAGHNLPEKSEKRRYFEPFYSLMPFFLPYRLRVFGVFLALCFAAFSVLGLGIGLRHLVDQGFGSGQETQMNAVLLYTIGLGLLLSLASFARSYGVSTLTERVTADIRKKMFKHVVTLHPWVFETISYNDVISRITTDLSTIQVVIGSSLSMALRNVLLILGGCFALILRDYKLCLLILLSVLTILFTLRILGKWVKKFSTLSQGGIADIAHFGQEALSELRVIQAYNQEPFVVSKFSETTERAFVWAKKRVLYKSLLTTCAISLAFMSVVGVLWVGGMRVINGAMQPGELVEFLYYSVITASALGALSEVFAELQRASGAALRCKEILDTKSPIRSYQQDFQSRPFGSKVNPKIKHDGMLIFEKVSFSYPMRPKNIVLRHFSHHIELGKTIAVVGSSGAGKTTLFQLLLRFYDPTSGSIYCGGADIRGMNLKELRKMFAWVPQEPKLFTGTLRENLCIGKQTHSDLALIRALKNASADDLLELLPDGLDTPLGYHGAKISVGQKQRVVLARALLKNAPILLLDEATSAQDAENEERIKNAIQAMMKEKTSIIIAHRLSTVLRADQIIVMERGRKIAEGTHHDLLEQCPTYRKLAQLQFVDGVLHNKG